MFKVEVIEDNGGAMRSQRHFRVKVNGRVLFDRRGLDRRFSDSIGAAMAGSRYVDEVLRPQLPESSCTCNSEVQSHNPRCPKHGHLAHRGGR